VSLLTWYVLPGKPVVTLLVPTSLADGCCRRIDLGTTSLAPTSRCNTDSMLSSDAELADALVGVCTPWRW
jgi:hypothetical protein